MSEDETKRASALEQETIVAFSGPALNSNKMICTIGPVVRLSFLEVGPDGVPHFRTAVSLHIQDAIELRKLLERLLADPEKQITEALTTEQEKKDG